MAARLNPRFGGPLTIGRWSCRDREGKVSCRKWTLMADRLRGPSARARRGEGAASKLRAVAVESSEIGDHASDRKRTSGDAEDRVIEPRTTTGPVHVATNLY